MDKIKAKWRQLEESERDFAEIVPLLSIHEEIGKLYPFISLGRLCLSRCTDYPYFVDFVISSAETGFSLGVTTRAGGWTDTKELVRGSAERIVSTLEESIPADYGTAIDGSASDLPVQ